MDAEDLSEKYQYRVTENGHIHCWPRGEKAPAEARWDICPNGCLTKTGKPQRLKPDKIEFEGEKGKVHRIYKCPTCGYVGRTIRRQKRNLTRWTLKEPERGKE